MGELNGQFNARIHALELILENETSLPAVTSVDNGDVLAVVDGAWAKTDLPSELPAYTASDIGKVLMVVDYGDGEVRVIVPQQTKFFMDSTDTVSLDNVDTTAFVVGATATLILSSQDGSMSPTEYSVTCTVGANGVRTFSSEDCPVTITKRNNGSVVATSQIEGELTIFLSQVTPNPQLAWVSVDAGN